MENQATMPEPQTPPQMPAKKAEHWLVQVVGGFTLASTMVSGLAMFYIALQFGSRAFS